MAQVSKIKVYVSGSHSAALGHVVTRTYNSEVCCVPTELSLNSKSKSKLSVGCEHITCFVNLCFIIV